MSDKQCVNTKNAPAAIGPYSQAVVANGMVFTSGQVAMEPATGELVSGGVEVQTRRVMENLSAVLTACGTSLEKVVKASIFLKDMNDFQVVNEVYGSYFSDGNPPARSTVQVSRLPKDVDVEIDMVAIVAD